MSWAFQPLLPSASPSVATLPGYVKVYMGATEGWVYKPVKYWNGSQWVIKPARWYNTATSTWTTTSGA